MSIKCDLQMTKSDRHRQFCAMTEPQCLLACNWHQNGEWGQAVHFGVWRKNHNFSQLTTKKWAFFGPWGPNSATLGKNLPTINRLGYQLITLPNQRSTHYLHFIYKACKIPIIFVESDLIDLIPWPNSAIFKKLPPMYKPPKK